jgi:hypothetical protein
VASDLVDLASQLGAEPPRMVIKRVWRKLASAVRCSSSGEQPHGPPLVLSRRRHAFCSHHDEKRSTRHLLPGIWIIRRLAGVAINAGRLTLDPVFPNQLNSCKSLAPVLGPVLLTCEPVAGGPATNT